MRCFCYLLLVLLFVYALPIAYAGDAEWFTLAHDVYLENGLRFAVQEVTRGGNDIHALIELSLHGDACAVGLEDFAIANADGRTYMPASASAPGTDYALAPGELLVLQNGTGIVLEWHFEGVPADGYVLYLRYRQTGSIRRLCVLPFVEPSRPKETTFIASGSGTTNGGSSGSGQGSVQDVISRIETWEFNYFVGASSPGVSYEQPKRKCMACYSGTCKNCNGSGILRMYGVTTACPCGDGKCGVCNGTGYW